MIGKGSDEAQSSRSNVWASMHEFAEKLHYLFARYPPSLSESGSSWVSRDVSISVINIINNSTLSDLESDQSGLARGCRFANFGGYSEGTSITGTSNRTMSFPTDAHGAQLFSVEKTASSVPSEWTSSRQTESTAMKSSESGFGADAGTESTVSLNTFNTLKSSHELCKAGQHEFRIINEVHEVHKSSAMTRNVVRVVIAPCKTSDTLTVVATDDARPKLIKKLGMFKNRFQQKMWKIDGRKSNNEVVSKEDHTRSLSPTFSSSTQGFQATNSILQTQISSSDRSDFGDVECCDACKKLINATESYQNKHETWSSRSEYHYSEQDLTFSDDTGIVSSSQSSSRSSDADRSSVCRSDYDISGPCNKTRHTFAGDTLMLSGTDSRQSFVFKNSSYDLESVKKSFSFCENCKTVASGGDSLEKLNNDQCKVIKEIRLGGDQEASPNIIEEANEYLSIELIAPMTQTSPANAVIRQQSSEERIDCPFPISVESHKSFSNSEPISSPIRSSEVVRVNVGHAINEDKSLLMKEAIRDPLPISPLATRNNMNLEKSRNRNSNGGSEHELQYVTEKKNLTEMKRRIECEIDSIDAIKVDQASDYGVEVDLALLNDATWPAVAPYHLNYYEGDIFQEGKPNSTQPAGGAVDGSFVATQSQNWGIDVSHNDSVAAPLNRNDIHRLLIVKREGDQSERSFIESLLSSGSGIGQEAQSRLLEGGAKVTDVMFATAGLRQPVAVDFDCHNTVERKPTSEVKQMVLDAKDTEKARHDEELSGQSSDWFSDRYKKIDGHDARNPDIDNFLNNPSRSYLDARNRVQATTAKLPSEASFDVVIDEMSLQTAENNDELKSNRHQPGKANDTGDMLLADPFGSGVEFTESQNEKVMRLSKDEFDADDAEGTNRFLLLQMRVDNSAHQMHSSPQRKIAANDFAPFDPTASSMALPEVGRNVPEQPSPFAEAFENPFLTNKTSSFDFDDVFFAESRDDITCERGSTECVADKRMGLDLLFPLEPVEDAAPTHKFSLPVIRQFREDEVLPRKENHPNQRNALAQRPEVPKGVDKSLVSIDDEAWHEQMSKGDFFKTEEWMNLPEIASARSEQGNLNELKGNLQKRQLTNLDTMGRSSMGFGVEVSEKQEYLSGKFGNDCVLYDTYLGATPSSSKQSTGKREQGRQLSAENFGYSVASGKDEVARQRRKFVGENQASFLSSFGRRLLFLVPRRNQAEPSQFASVYRQTEEEYLGLMQVRSQRRTNNNGAGRRSVWSASDQRGGRGHCKGGKNMGELGSTPAQGEHRMIDSLPVFASEGIEVMYATERNVSRGTQRQPRDTKRQSRVTRSRPVVYWKKATS